MTVYLGLDYGEKRIGVACSDETGSIADALGFIENSSRDTILSRITQYLEDFKVSVIVVGLPKTTQGEIGTQAQRVLKFVEQLAGRVTCKVVTWDERFTSQAADRVFREADLARGKRRLKRDGLAAQMMLQNYLDYERLRRTHVSTD